MTVRDGAGFATMLRGARWRSLVDRVQLIVTVLNPWQWFCSTRTLSNCLETTLTVVALDLWPWQWSAGLESTDSRNKSVGSERELAEGRTLLWKYDCIDRTDQIAADAHRM